MRMNRTDRVRRRAEFATVSSGRCCRKCEHLESSDAICVFELEACARSLVQANHGGTKMAVWCIPELVDESVFLERVLDDASLHAFAAAVNQTHDAEARSVGRGNVLLDD